MPITQLNKNQINSVDRDDFDTTTPGKAVITKIIQGTGITISSTGADPGTGDVTINASGGSSGDDIILPDYTGTNAPSPAPTSGINLYAQYNTGERIPTFQRPDGEVVGLQNAIAFSNRSISWAQSNGTTGVNVYGSATANIAGTGTARTMTASSWLGSIRRTGFVSASGVNQLASVRVSSNEFGVIGDTNGVGGFSFSVKFAIPNWVPGVSMGAGVNSNGNLSATYEPSMLSNAMMICIDTTDSTFQFVNKNGTSTTNTATRTKTNTGWTPDPTAAYAFRVQCDANPTQIFMTLENLKTGAMVSHIIDSSIHTSSFPARTVPLVWVAGINTAAVGGVQSIDFIQTYIESFYKHP